VKVEDAMRCALSLALLVLVTLAAAPAQAFQFADCGGTACRWKSYPLSFWVRDPLGVSIDDEGAVDEIRASFDRWSYQHQTLCGPLAFEYRGRFKTDAGAGQDGKNMVYFETSAWPYGESALAVTQLWYDGSGYLREADIAFNAVNHLWTVDATDEAGNTYAIRPTLTHEAGHFWGLDHSQEKMATMYAYYHPNSEPEDLDFDDIAAEADMFCDAPPPPDDAFEQNDSFSSFGELDGLSSVEGLRLYDDDWFRVTLAEGKRLKLTVTDESGQRFKRLALYDLYNNLIEEQPCYGDCAQALGQAGAEQRVALLIRGDYDDNRLQTERYSFAVEQVLPGQEGELSDDDLPSGDDDDHPRACGCAVSHAAPLDAGCFAALLAAALWLRRRAR
jgi:hypothetical protein